MRTLWILALCCLAFLVVDAKRERHRWKPWKYVKKNLTKKPKEHLDCTVLPSRLLDWFHILRTAHIKEEMVAKGLSVPKHGEVIPRMKLKEANMPFPSGASQNACREPISSVFRYVFDQNADGVLDDSELADVYEAEPCMTGFFKECAKGKETFTEAEFCSCFSTVEPPCFHQLRNLPSLLVRGNPHLLPGVYIPSCDQDGYYLPRQCKAVGKKGSKECWCVDRHGIKLEGLTKCVDNTEPPAGEKHEEPAVKPSE